MYDLVLLASPFLLFELAFTFGAFVLAFTHILVFVSLFFCCFLVIFSLFSRANTSGMSNPSKSGGVRYAPFSLGIYLRKYRNFLDTEKFAPMPSNGEAENIHVARNGLDHDTALGARSRRCAHWGGSVVFPQNNDIR